MLCLDNWLKQGIIQPSKKYLCLTGGNHLQRKLVKFPHAWISESLMQFPSMIYFPLQAVQAVVYFSSFDLAQGYLEMAIEESDILKTVFCAGSIGLYEFTHLLFGLTNVGASFCHLMEMWIGDQ